MNGWLVLDKPLGLSSCRLGNLVKKSLKIKKLGHFGTLDPFASGVLTFAIGEATKMLPYIKKEAYKKYCFTIQWGESRDTDDCEGKTIKTNAIYPSENQILEVLPCFIGIIEQIPPIYSAVHVQGKRAYALARQGVDVKISARLIEIRTLKLIEVQPTTASFEVECQGGTYIRSLARDLAKALGTLGYVFRLRRLSDGLFSEKDTIYVEKNEGIPHISIRDLLPIEAVLDDIPVVSISLAEAQGFQKGQRIIRHAPQGLWRIFFKDSFLGIGRQVHDFLNPERVLCNIFLGSL